MPMDAMQQEEILQELEMNRASMQVLEGRTLQTVTLLAVLEIQIRWMSGCRLALTLMPPRM